MSEKHNGPRVDTESDDGRAPIPSVRQVSTWDPEKLAEAYVRSARRVAELGAELVTYQSASAYPPGSAMRHRFEAIRASKLWHQSLKATIHQVRLLPKKSSAAPAAKAASVSDRVTASVIAKAAATIQRREDADRCFVEAARAALPPEQYEQLWNEARNIATALRRAREAGEAPRE